MPDQGIKKIDIGDGAAIPKADDWGLHRAWWIAFCGTIGLLIALPMYDPETFGRALSFIPDGILVTFEVTVLSMGLAIVIGLLTGLGRLSKNKFINLMASLFIIEERCCEFSLLSEHIFFARIDSPSVINFLPRVDCPTLFAIKGFDNLMFAHL